MKHQFPQSARDALARQTAADGHPSADLLNGFLERALAADENARVTAHLASCAECRDIAFLAGAANQDEQRAPSASPALAWARWGAGKWLVPAMAALVIVAGVVMERQRTPILRPPEANVATNTPSPGATKESPEPTMQARSAVPDELHSPARPYSSDVSKEQWKKKTDSATGAAQQSRALALHGESMGSKDRDLTNLAQATPPSPPLNGVPRGIWPPAPGAVAKTATPAPAASPPQSAATPARPQSQTVEVTAAAPLVQADNADLQAQSKAAVASPAGVPSQTSADAAAVANQPGAPAASGSGASSRKAAGFGANGLSLAKRTVAPRWRISNDGHLERSTSPGEWIPVLSEQPVAFRTVASIANDVWAGGSGGALFHSPDAGEHWTKVALMADGQPETGALASIRFDTPAEGRVTTDAGRAWSTVDGGKTWTRQ